MARFLNEFQKYAEVASDEMRKLLCWGGSDSYCNVRTGIHYRGEQIGEKEKGQKVSGLSSSFIYFCLITSCSTSLPSSWLFMLCLYSWIYFMPLGKPLSSLPPSFLSLFWIPVRRWYARQMTAIYSQDICIRSHTALNIFITDITIDLNTYVWREGGGPRGCVMLSVIKW